MSKAAHPDDATVISPFTEQRPFLQSDKRYFGYISGVGAGKTFSGIIRTIRNMTEWNAGEMGAIVAPTRQMIVNVIIPEMRDLGLFDPPINWDYKSAYSDEPGIHTDDGSRALILSADNQKTIERLRGLNLAWGWIDEEAVVDPRAREILMQRLRSGEYRNMYITTTPKGRNHTYDFFVGDVDAEKTRHGEATLYETDDRRAIVGVPTHANPHTPEDYKEAMAGDLPDDIAAQEVRGEFVEIGSGVFTRQMLDFAEPDDLNDDITYQFTVGVDVGVEADAGRARAKDSDFWAAALLMTHPYERQAYLVDMRRERGLSLQQGVSWIREVVEPLPENSPIFVESNQSQRWLQQELKDQGLPANPVQNTRNKEERILQISVPLERGTVQLLNRDVDPSLGYDPKFQPLVQELLSFPDGAHDDMADALQIAVDNAPLGSNTNFMGADPFGGDDG